VVNVRFWPKADIPSCTAHVRFRGQSGRRPFAGNALELLQRIYKDPSFDIQTRIDAATKATPFESPKKSETTITDQQSYIVRMPAEMASLEEWQRTYDPEFGAKSDRPDEGWSATLEQIQADAAKTKKESMQ
jgi:hypothetical protein